MISMLLLSMCSWYIASPTCTNMYVWCWVVGNINRTCMDYLYVYMYILYAGHSDCISTLVGSGADVNSKDKKQYTPLHSAAAGGQANAVKLLLELGADVSSPPPP